MDSTYTRQLASADFALLVDEYRLRPWRADDARTMTDIVSEPSIPRWTFLPYGMTADQAERWIENRGSQRMSGSEVARVRLSTAPDNPPSRRVAERVGFEQEGRLRRGAVDKQGQRGDLLLYGLLPEDVTS
jgi:RimJ/RimL family protein N-acetyltransferase